MKLYTKILLFLLFLSLVWLYTVADLTYNTLFFESSTFLSKCIGYHAQFELIYILGVFLFVSYLALILFIKNKKLY
ncbi:hypothetical protein B0I03_103214 [Flavobacterium aquaticum]|uniref:Uncharacterized protein n=1 Tax=Flavobacterium aquaticum TaxID=1236486 RepID=A0A327YRR5_9FLAO|nr:hypothetical protein B0I03_103214 [Flavobacterium aquaticum]